MKLTTSELIGIMAGFCSVAGLYFSPGIAPKIILASVALIILVALLYQRFKRSKNEVAAKSLNSLVKGDKTHKVKVIKNRAQLKELWELDEKCYGEDNIPFQTLLEWWSSYQKGIHILLSNNRVVGAIGFFPIKRHAFEQIIEGKLHEGEINSDLIESDATTYNHWYLSGIVLDVTFRKTNAIKLLLSEAINAWKDDLKNLEDIHICSIAYTKAGENLLRKFRFHRYTNAENTIYNYPTYLFETDDKEEIESLLKLVQ